jgi:hypothetical protein
MRDKEMIPSLFDRRVKSAKLSIHNSRCGLFGVTLKPLLSLDIEIYQSFVDFGSS